MFREGKAVFSAHRHAACDRSTRARTCMYTPAIRGDCTFAACCLDLPPPLSAPLSLTSGCNHVSVHGGRDPRRPRYQRHVEHIVPWEPRDCGGQIPALREGCRSRLVDSFVDCGASRHSTNVFAGKYTNPMFMTLTSNHHHHHHHHHAHHHAHHHHHHPVNGAGQPA